MRWKGCKTLVVLLLTDNACNSLPVCFLFRSLSDETTMTANQAQGIVEYMPTLDERQKLRDYMKAGDGDSASKFDKLCECEKFMVAMMTVKQSKRKLRALLFKLQFRGCIHDLARGKKNASLFVI